MRDWLDVQAKPEVNRFGRSLDKTPHNIAVIVAHQAIAYGTFLEDMQGGYILKLLKRAIFQAVRDTIADASH